MLQVSQGHSFLLDQPKFLRIPLTVHELDICLDAVVIFWLCVCCSNCLVSDTRLLDDELMADDVLAVQLSLFAWRMCRRRDRIISIAQLFSGSGISGGGRRTKPGKPLLW